ncbi:uncharacterized protein LOC142864132 isoform X1 [Microcebus murinus]|uniref:uncharacterized protein LOC142864132 isoform X1 n=1 Tax=Microcebus murinus TaxID=30608 RepID=UPI003F6B8116
MEFLPMVAESATICAKATAGSGQNRRILLAFLLRGKRITADRVDRELQAWSGDRRVPGLGNSIDVLAGTRRGGLPSRSRGGGGKQPRVAGVRRRPRFPPGGGEDSTAPAPQLTLEDWVAPARCSALQSGPGEPPGSYKSVPGPPCAEDPGHDKTRHPVWAGTHTDDQSSITSSGGWDVQDHATGIWCLVRTFLLFPHVVDGRGQAGTNAHSLAGQRVKESKSTSASPFQQWRQSITEGGVFMIKTLLIRPHLPTYCIGD